MRIWRLAIVLMLVLVASACSNSEPDQVVTGSSSTTAATSTSTTAPTSTTTNPLPTSTTAVPLADGAAEPLTLGEATSFDGLDLPEADFTNIGRPGRGQTEEVDAELDQGPIGIGGPASSYVQGSGNHIATFDTPEEDVTWTFYEVDDPESGLLYCDSVQRLGLGGSGGCGGGRPVAADCPWPTGMGTAGPNALPPENQNSLRWESAAGVLAIDVITTDGTIARTNVVGSIAYTSYPSEHGEALRAVAYYPNGSTAELNLKDWPMPRPTQCATS